MEYIIYREDNANTAATQPSKTVTLVKGFLYVNSFWGEMPNNFYIVGLLAKSKIPINFHSTWDPPTRSIKPLIVCNVERVDKRNKVKEVNLSHNDPLDKTPNSLQGRAGR